MKEPLRVAGVLALGAFTSAVALAALLILLANLDSGQPLATDLSVLRVLMMSLAITVSLGLPLYLLFRHFHLLRVWICAMTGGVIAVSFPYGFRVWGFGVSLPWRVIFWFAMSGAAGGAVMGALVRPPKSLSRTLSQG